MGSEERKTQLGTRVNNEPRAESREQLRGARAPER